MEEAIVAWKFTYIISIDENGLSFSDVYVHSMYI